ncbi:amphi-Trp domain-containing protein [Salsuginibacillus kocurii]|uniref:amphi-Trp domain-containing protein n=1 Tax=Salsuginibacillus kocurii TaxID=427078 RepID=UPI00036225B8|nr:amphi-Trp domain-containing protein [Salsuginibacillus kocurii]
MFGQDRLEQTVHIDYEERRQLHDAAELFEQLAAKLRTDGSCTFVQGTEEVSISPAEMVELDIEYVQKGKKHALEFELKWMEAEEPPTKPKIK